MQTVTSEEAEQGRGGHQRCVAAGVSVRLDNEELVGLSPMINSLNSRDEEGGFLQFWRSKCITGRIGDLQGREKS